MSLSGQALQFTPVEGAGFSGVVARFTDTNPLPAANYNATITWGDSSTSPNVPVQLNNGVFEVRGSHLFGDEGNLPFDVSVIRQGMPIQSFDMSEQLVVADAPLTASGANVPAQTEGVQFTDVVVAHFTDANLSAPLSDFTGTGGATINWGDGSVSSGTVATHSGGGFDVTGTHTYQTKGSFSIAVQINDVGSSTTTATGTVQVNHPVNDPVTTSVLAIAGTEGAALPNGTVVATFTDQNRNAQNPNLLVTHTAHINWGDGNSVNGVVIEPSVTNGWVGQVTVPQGGHTYNEENNYQITVSVTDNQPIPNTDGGFNTITVADAPLNAVNAIQGNNNANPLSLVVNNLLVATFTDQGGAEAAKNYTATINWGDGTPPGPGTVTLGGNGTTFSVNGNHVYTIPGKNYTITTTITDDGGTQATTPAANNVFVGTQVERFIEHAYVDLLHRDVDPGALAFWRNYLTAPNAPANARGLMVLTIEGTSEYRGDVVDSYFFKYLGRHILGVDQNAINAFTGYLNAGGTYEGVKAIIIGSDEYFIKHGNNANAFLDALFVDTLGRHADPGAQQNQTLIGYAAGGAAKRTFLTQAVITTPEGLSYIVKGYFNNNAVPDGPFLHRPADQGALNFYVSVLQRGVRDEFVIADIVGSQEYLNLV